MESNTDVIIRVRGYSVSINRIAEQHLKWILGVKLMTNFSTSSLPKIANPSHFTIEHLLRFNSTTIANLDPDSTIGSAFEMAFTASKMFSPNLREGLFRVVDASSSRLP